MKAPRGFMVLALGIMLALLGFSAGVLGAARAAVEPFSDKVSPWVVDATADGAQVDFLVVLAEQADLSPARALPTKQARGRWVYETLWETAQRSQTPLRAWLDARGVPYRSYYIVNLLHVRAGDRALVEALAARPDVARIEANPRIRNVEPRPAAPLAPLSPKGIEWNVSHVGAPDVWALGYTGQGVVVGGQDTGYDWDHPALVNQYRGWNGSSADHDYNWHDAVHSGGGVCGPDSPEPCDDDDHGTHTMGTVLGDDGGTNQIGVAPGARWIGCRNMNQGDGTPAMYLECFEFFLAPYPVSGDPSQGNPDLAPDVTNNSWTCPPSEGCSWDTLQAAVEAHRAAGIMTVASAGNDGLSCNSVQDPPAIYDAAYSVGATDNADDIALFSSRGPVTVDGSDRLKPDLSAPGVGIRSSVRGGGYQGGWGGTSMAGPHVAGVVALLWSAQPALRGQIGQTEAILNTAAVPLYSTQCGDPPNTVPNNVYGWGRVDALNAVQQPLALDAGYLDGTATTTGSGVPIQGVTVRAVAVAGAPSYAATTDAGGYYTVTIFADSYAVSAWKYGYTLQTVTDVVVLDDTVTTIPFTLTQTAPYSLIGCATDSVTGDPLPATISVLGPFGDLIAQTTASQATGCYTFTLHGGLYTVTAQVPLYQSGVVVVNLAADTVQGFALMPDPVYNVGLGPATASQTTLPGQIVTYTLQVTNTSNVPDTIAFTRTTPGWSTDFSVTSTLVAAGDHQDVRIYVTVPATTADGVSDAAVIRATGSGGHAESSLTTTVLWRKIYLPLVTRDWLSP